MHIKGIDLRFVQTIVLFTFFLHVDLQVISQTHILKDSSTGAMSSIIAPNAKLHLISDQFSFTEGPAADQEGNVYFTDQPNNKIWKYGIDGKLSVFLENAGRSNGMYFEQNGDLVTCADEQNQLWRITPEKEIKILLTNFKGKQLNGPNDLWINNSGGIYFTDPYYQREYWTRKHPAIEEQRVYYFSDNIVVIAADGLQQPNGIIGTPDNKFLYIADIKADKTYRYNIGANGKLFNKTLFAQQGSDGMTTDNAGNIYLTGNGVTVYDSTGRLIEQIPVPQKWTANVTFGGKGRDQLFITASNAIYSLQMKVKGAY